MNNILRYFAGTLFAMALPLATAAQEFDSYFTPEEAPATIGRRVAQRFIEVPHPNFDTNPEPTREITYPETCAWIGALRFAALTGDKEMTSRLEQRFLPILGEERRLQPLPDHVDHTVFGSVPLDLYRQTGNKAYRHLGLWYADRQWTMPECSRRDSVRYSLLLDHGLSWQTRFWIDDMFMVTSVQGRAFDVTGDSRYIDRAAYQMTAYLDSIQCDNALFYHAPEAPFHWCRGNGWMAAGMTELLSRLPDNHPLRPRIMESFTRMMATLISFQHPDGLWGQLIDEPEAWSETSGSAMFLYAMITGVKKGWLDSTTYVPAIVRGWKAIVSHINESGDIDGVCEGTNKSSSREFYLKRRVLTGNMHGQAPVLWCACAFLDSTPTGTVTSTDRAARYMTYNRFYGENGESRWLYGVFRQLARHSAGLPLEADGMDNVFDVIKSNHDCNDFTLNGLLRILYNDRKQGKLSKEQQEKAKERILDFKYWWDDGRSDTTYRCYHTENHQALYHTAELLAGQMFKKQRFANGMTGRQHVEHAKELLLPWLDNRFRFGFSEWLSTYYDVEVLLLTNLYDFAEDRTIREKARALLDMLFFDIALNSRDGFLCGTSGRMYATTLLSGSNTTGPSAWLAFGIGSYSLTQMAGAPALASSAYRCPEIISAIASDKSVMTNRQRVSLDIEDAETYGLKADNERDCRLFWGMQEFIHPATVGISKQVSEKYDVWPYRDYDRYIETYDRERAEKGSVTSRERFALSEANIITYRTPHYSLSSVQDFRKGLAGYQQYPWQATISPEVIIYTNHPGGTNLRNSPNYWAGNEILPRTAQTDNLCFCIYNIPESHQTGFTHAYFPVREMDETIIRGNWIFGRKGRSYVALYSSTLPCLQKDFRGEYCDVTASSRNNIWICEMGSADRWGSFHSFADEIADSQVITDGLSAEYHSPTAGTVSFGWERPLTVNGETVSLKGDYRYDNPYCRAPFGSDTITIRYNGMTYDITKK